MLERYERRILPFPWDPAITVLDSSKINTFLDCNRQFFFRYLLGWEMDKANNHLVFGSAWHEAMEHLLLNDYSEDSVMQAFDKFLETYRAEFPEETDAIFAPKTPDRALLALMEYAERYRDEDDSHQTLYTEIAGEISIDGERSLAFRMDSICENASGAVFSLEHKTKGGPFSRVWVDQWALSVQVGAYNHVLQCSYLDTPIRGVIINGVSFQKTKFDFQRVLAYRSPEHLQSWLFHINHYFDQIEEEMQQLADNCTSNDEVLTAFPMNPGACTKYFGCQYFDFCNAWANPLKHCDSPPPGFLVRYWNPLAQPAKVVVKV